MTPAQHSAKIALDRSMRSVDADGHMRVEITNISKANVCPYYGREIPDHEALGLDPNRVYRLYRDPAELAAAAHTFAGKPLLMHHQPVSSDEHPQELVVGTVGTEVAYAHPYLQAPLVLWTDEAITAVESRKQKELSPGYRYRADMTPGRSPEGVAYDGVMRDIMGNHVALVAEGRTGPDVMVADETPPEFSKMRFPRLVAALASLFPAAPAPAQLAAFDAALDADLDADTLTADEQTAALDAACKTLGKAMDKLTDEDKADAYKRAAKDKRAKDGEPKAATKTAPPHAADEATVKLAVDAAVAAAVADMVPKATAAQMATDAAAAVHALYAARVAVEPTVGVTALDSAELTYRMALDHLKVEHKDIPAAALAALYTQSAKAAAPTQVAQDAALPFDPTILGLSHIRKG